MKQLYLATGVALSVFALGVGPGTAQSLPPAAPSVPATDTYFGTVVTDPYRNLENLQDPAVLAWMKAQADHARRTLDAIPGRAGLIAKMQEIDGRRAAGVYGLQIADNDRYFYFKLRPEDQQAKLYCREGYQGAEVLLFDPETAEKGKVFTINNFAASQDGSKVSLALSEKGAEVGEVRILNVNTRQFYPERLLRARSAGAWLPDHNSFTYTPYNNADVKDPAARLNTQAYRHRVGTPVSEDQALFSAKINPELSITPNVYPTLAYERNSGFVLGILGSVSRYLNVYYAPVAALAKPAIAWKPLFRPEQEVTVFTSDGRDFYFLTSKNAPRQRLMRMAVAQPDVAKAEVLVAESADEAFDGQLRVTKDGLYFVRTRNGVEAKLYFVARGTTKVQEIKLPQPAGALALEAKNAQSSELWVVPRGWNSAQKRYRYVAATRQFQKEMLSSEVAYPEYAELVVEELLVPSHDGVRVPVSLMYKKGTPRDGRAPVLIRGYGAYASSQSPLFDPSGALLWAQQGGIVAVAHVRGGGELGEAWHKAGMKTTKPNTWKDLIVTAEYLVKNRYTAPGRIAINSASAGGIMIGRAMTERPDLFAAAIPQVGSMNPIRLENSPNGPVNTPEYGTVQKEDEARAMLEMDSFHHLKPGMNYPATLVTAGFNDPRVIAWEPAKFAARLQASTASGKPVLFLTDYEAGHGIGNSKQKNYEAQADVLAFGLWQTGHPAFQPVAAAAK
ncbi:hypothetical protein BEN47_15590 [Hymenobacter lapidarius]|uniref:prolyl oligopeptidase n=1 Tax=Hymenobacter lapidarius TaxID=1908237 RepID=A0A1G1T280_9BACT|nr:prolyl oligopeptidase family serine peptidase [Hymenobacter lapidarius]OGX84991.1 hypothetical protein BEN47_15590 [Hymenobacter lapidarius]